jgi:hypothetical protein
VTPIDKAAERALRTNLEAIVTFRAGLGLTAATPLQRAICRIATGEPLAELASHPDVIEAVGRVDLLWGQPDELYLLAPSRTGKSTIIAGLALRATQTVDLAAAGDVKGERPRYTIISIEKDKAKAIFAVIAEALRGPFAHLAARDPSDSSLTAIVHHPSGAEVEIVVAAGKAGGAAVLSRWCIGLALDEATRMHGDERQISVKATRTAALDRLLPGAQIVYLGSKWGTEGPVYEAAKEHGGRPSRQKSVVVIGWEGCEGHTLNPLQYPPGKYEAIRAKDDGESAWLVATNQWQSPPQKIFALSYLQKLARPAARCDCDARQRAGLPSSNSEPACPHNDSPPHPRQHYVAVIDPATRGNAWALVLLTVRELIDGYRDDVALCRQWQGSSAAPLDPNAVFAEIAELLRPYRCNRVYTDPWGADALRTVARQHGLYLIEVLSPEGKALRMADKVQSFEAVKSALAMHERGHHDHRSLELHPCPALLGDLSRVVKRTTLSGVVVELPLTGDGRHCDYAAALALGYTQVLQRPDREPEQLPGDWTQHELDEADKMAQRLGLAEGDPDECRYEELEDEYGW